MYKKFNYENLVIFEIVKILEVCKLLNFKIKKCAKLRTFSKNCRVLELFVNLINSHNCPLIYFVT